MQFVCTRDIMHRYSLRVLPWTKNAIFSILSASATSVGCCRCSERTPPCWEHVSPWMYWRLLLRQMLIFLTWYSWEAAASIQTAVPTVTILVHAVQAFQADNYQHALLKILKAICEIDSEVLDLFDNVWNRDIAEGQQLPALCLSFGSYPTVAGVPQVKY